MGGPSQSEVAPDQCGSPLIRLVRTRAWWEGENRDFVLCEMKDLG